MGCGGGDAPCTRGTRFLFHSCSHWGWACQGFLLLGGHDDGEVSVAVAKFPAIPGNELAKWLSRVMPKSSRMTFWLGACPVGDTGHAADNLECHHKHGDHVSRRSRGEDLFCSTCQQGVAFCTAVKITSDLTTYLAFQQHTKP